MSSEILSLAEDYRLNGSAEAADAVFAAIYERLTRIAHNQIRAFGGHVTVNTHTLVHEAYLKVAKSEGGLPREPLHMVNLHARVMRQVLLDMCKQRGRLRHGANAQRMDLSTSIEGRRFGLDDLLSMEAALERLQQEDAELAEIVDQHVFAGLETDEIADLRGISRRTVSRKLELARVLLADLLEIDRPST